MNNSLGIGKYVVLGLLCATMAGCVVPSDAETDIPSTTAPATPSPGLVDVRQTATSPPAHIGKPTATLSIDYQWVDASPASDKFTVVTIELGSEDLLDILRVEAQKAAELGRHPYVEFYADWCPPCNAIRDCLGTPQMVDAFAGTYIIRLDLDDWKPKLSETGFYVVGIPAFYEIDTEGKPTGRMITGAAWGEDIPANIAPPMKAFFQGN